MKSDIWSQLVNTFEVNTKGSRRKMLRIANHHYARLQAMKSDPFILALLTLFEPALLLYRSMFSNLDSQEGISVSNTANFTDMLDEMRDKWVNKWQTMVRQVFEVGTPEYIAIFPRGTEGFGTKQFTASMIEEQRLVLADLLDDNLCDLKKKYRKTIKMVENYFDLSELRRPSSDTDSRFVSSGAVEQGMTTAVSLPDKLKMSANADTIIMNRSNQVELQFFYSVNASASDNPVKLNVLAMQSVQSTAADAGWAPGAKYLIVKNLGTVTAEFEVQVTEAIE
jgi:hypothetical protein